VKYHAILKPNMDYVDIEIIGIKGKS